jgi:photosystem II stability/assembly factor-like uncharacterized protein
MLACISPNGRASYVHDAPPTTLLVGTIDGVVTLERNEGQASWHRTASSLAGHQISALVTEPKSGRVFAGTAGRGLFTSTDGGASWQLRTSGLRNQHVFAMALDERPANPVLYAGMLPPALYRSFDLGLTWEELPSLNDVPDADKWNFRAPPGAPHVKNVAFHPTDLDTLYVCIEQGGLLRSTNAGRTWSEIDTWFHPEDTFYRDAHRLVHATGDPRLMYLATGDGVCRSTDAGATWTRLTTGADRVGYPDALLLDPKDSDVLYVAGAGGHPGTWNQQTARPGVVRSADAGRTWQELGDGLPSPLRGNIEAMSMVSWPGGLGLYLGTAVGEVWSSEDGGAHWQLIAETAAVSKAGHFRKFLSPEERERVERELLRLA